MVPPGWQSNFKHAASCVSPCAGMMMRSASNTRSSYAPSQSAQTWLPPPTALVPRALPSEPLKTLRKQHSNSRFALRNNLPNVIKQSCPRHFAQVHRRERGVLNIALDPQFCCIAVQMLQVCEILASEHAQRRSRSLSCCASPSSSTNGATAPILGDTRRRPQYIPGRIDDPDYVRIFDTTLRDGEQSPGATLTSKEKMEIAKQLAKLGVDIIEAGFPAASPDDFEAVRSIALHVGNAVDADGHTPVICGLSRCVIKDMDAAWEAVRLARLPRVHIFIATSQIHMEYKLKMTPDQVVENAVKAVTYLRSRGCEDIEFSPEDAGRSEPEFLYRILEDVIKAGATTLNIPDTVGWCMPHEFGEKIAGIIANTPGAENVVISTHCQNDLGLATANSLSGAFAGARQCECTINGIGERAGNASLEEVAMSIYKRGEVALGGLWTGIRPQQISIASKMVKDFTGVMLQPHKAIVGSNAYAHESGIHQDGMLKNKLTYEIIAPEEIGFQRADPAGLVLGKHSGRNALRNRLSFLGFELQQVMLDDVFKRFKAVADNKKIVSDEDILALLGDEANQSEKLWDLLDLQVVCGTMGLPTATVRMRGPDGIMRTATGMGTGPFDAATKAIDFLVRVPAQLANYTVNAVTQGPEALATTRVSLCPKGGLADQGLKTSAQGSTQQRMFSGNGADDDIVVSSARAYVSAINKMIAFVSKNEQRAAEAADQKAMRSMDEEVRVPVAQ